MILDFSTRQESDVTVVELKGRLTLGNQLVSAEAKMKSLFESGPVKVVFDLAQLDYTDSAGIGMLMMCAGTARSHNGQFHIAGASERVAKIFEIAHVGKVIPVYADVPSAIAAFA